jgi:hypothetical protein
MGKYAISEASTIQISQYFVKEIVFRHKCSEKLLLDRKLAFIGEIMTETTHKLKIYTLRTSVFIYKLMINRKI